MTMGTAPAVGFAAPPIAAEAGKRLGWDAGQPALYETWGLPAAYPKRPLSSGHDALPELAEEQVVARRMWRHPAFIVSILTTLLALIAGAVLTVLGVLAEGVPTVSDLQITAGEGNVHLQWSGPDTPYSLFVVQPGGDEAVDISQLVRGREAWIPLYADLIDDNSCFVVRAAEVTATTIDTDADTLKDQGASSTCVNDAEK